MTKCKKCNGCFDIIYLEDINHHPHRFLYCDLCNEYFQGKDELEFVSKEKLMEILRDENKQSIDS
jgi:hypothetical protein